MKVIQEFKEFAVKGSGLDLAIGVIIGAAFGKIVTSLVEEVLLPPLAYLIGRINFANMFWSLDGKKYATLEAAKKAGAPTQAASAKPTSHFHCDTMGEGKELDK